MTKKETLKGNFDFVIPTSFTKHLRRLRFQNVFTKNFEQKEYFLQLDWFPTYKF